METMESQNVQIAIKSLKRQSLKTIPTPDHDSHTR